VSRKRVARISESVREILNLGRLAGDSEAFWTWVGDKRSHGSTRLQRKRDEAAADHAKALLPTFLLDPTCRNGYSAEIRAGAVLHDADRRLVRSPGDAGAIRPRNGPEAARMKARKRAQPQPPKWRSPIDDPATFERISNLLGTLLDPINFDRYERTAQEEERDLICLYAAKDRPADPRGGLRHVTACRLSLSWRFPKHYGPTAPPDVRRQKHLDLLMGETVPQARTE
jgi:hypothetical protein